MQTDTNRYNIRPARLVTYAETPRRKVQLFFSMRLWVFVRGFDHYVCRIVGRLSLSRTWPIGKGTEFGCPIQQMEREGRFRSAGNQRSLHLQFEI